MVPIVRNNGAQSMKTAIIVLFIRKAYQPVKYFSGETVNFDNSK